MTIPENNDNVRRSTTSTCPKCGAFVSRYDITNQPLKKCNVCGTLLVIQIPQQSNFWLMWTFVTILAIAETLRLNFGWTRASQISIGLCVILHSIAYYITAYPVADTNPNPIGYSESRNKGWFAREKRSFGRILSDIIWPAYILLLIIPSEYSNKSGIISLNSTIPAIIVLLLVIRSHYLSRTCPSVQKAG